MPVVSRIARIRLDGLVGAFREWRAEAAVQDTAAGSLVDVTTTQTSGGVAPGIADALTLEFRNDAGGVIRTVTLTPGSSSQVTTFFFTNDGQSGGAARCGTVEIVLRATKNTGLATEQYDLESDGSPNSPPATFSATFDRGWIRGTTTATASLSNASLGGATPNPFAYDDDVFYRLVLGAAPYVSAAITMTVSPELSTSISSATANFDATFADVVDERFPASNVSRTTGNTVGNAALTGQPWTVLTTTQASANFDARLTATHLNQYDDDVFASPPMSGDETNTRLSSQLAFLATRITNARGEGVDGLTVTQSIDPINPGTTVNESGATATRGGQAGWTPFMGWSSALPGGTWIKGADITAPSDIDSDAHLVGGTEEMTLLAPNPAISVRAGVHNLTSPGAHPVPGDTVRAAVDALSVLDNTRQTPDSGTVKVALTRYNTALGRLQHWTGSAWQTLGPDDAPALHAMAANANDAKLFELDFASDMNWADYDVRCEFQMKVLGVPYFVAVTREMVRTANRHDGNAFDGADFAAGFPFK